MEMQIIALATSTSENEKQVRSLIESYRRLLFPGAENDTKKEATIEQAKKALAEEAKKVYMVRKLTTPDQIQKEMVRAHQAGGTELAKAMAMELQKKEVANMKLKRKMSRQFSKVRGDTPD